MTSEIVFALGDVLSYINSRAFEQVGEYAGKDQFTLHNYKSSGEGIDPDRMPIDPTIFLSAIESVELLLESLAELYCIKVGSQTCKWAVVATIQLIK